MKDTTEEEVHGLRLCECLIKINACNEISEWRKASGVIDKVFRLRC